MQIIRVAAVLLTSALGVGTMSCGGSTPGRPSSAIGEFAAAYWPGALEAFEHANVNLEHPTSSPQHPIAGAPVGEPSPDATMVARGATGVTLSAADSTLPALQCGTQASGEVLCGTPGAPAAGSYIVAWFELQGDFPLDEQTLTYQYSLVFDRPGVLNYLPSQYPLDFFFGTDLWFELVKAPAVPFALRVQDARGGTISNIASAARVVVSGNLVAIVIPESEIGADGPQGYRATAHRHQGDYGAVKPWSGATSPSVGEPLGLVSTFCSGRYDCQTPDGETVALDFTAGTCTATVNGSNVTFAADGTLSSGTAPIGTFIVSGGRLTSITVGGQSATCVAAP